MTFGNAIMRWFVFVIAAACVLAAFVDITKAECDFGCSFLDRPACAIDAEGNTYEFRDDCEVRLKICKNPSKGYQLVPCDAAKKKEDAKEKS